MAEDFVGGALRTLVAWESTPAGTAKSLWHATKNLPAVIADGRLRPVAELDPSAGALGHAGYFAGGEKVSLTWSRARADKYLSALRLVVRVAQGRLDTVEATEALLDHAGLAWRALSPEVPWAGSFGSDVWDELDWLSDDERWALVASPPADIRALWRSASVAARASAWDTLMVVDRMIRERHDPDCALGVVDPSSAPFAGVDEGALGIVGVELRPGVLVDVREEEEELQVRSDDILRIWAVR